MNELAVRPLRTDPNQYFVSLVAEGRRLGLMSEAQAERVGMEMMALLAKLTQKVTHGASTSVRVETAQRLLSSAAYCIGHGLKALGSAEAALGVICDTAVSTLHAQGHERVDTSVAEARALLSKVQKGMLRTANLAYNDTLIHGLPLFFSAYDSEYGAHESPGSIDYPVCRVPDLTGVEYMLAYLKRADMENRFCRAAGYTDALLRGYHKDGRQLLVSLFELTLGCAVGAVLCGKAPADALVAEDVAYLAQRLREVPPARLKGMLVLACGQVCARLGMDEEISAHAAAVISDMLPHIQGALRTGHPEQVFIVPKPERERAKFVDGAKMDDEAFRALTEALRESRNISDKLAMIGERVHSMADLLDLLGAECLYGSEFDAVFATLDDVALRILKSRVVRDGLHASAAETEWQQRLARYLKNR